MASGGILSLPNLILACDLNLTLNASDIWGSKAQVDPLGPFFSKLFSDHHLVDVAPPFVGPTWRNGRMGEDGISKRLDRFLLSDQLISSLPRHRVWTHRSGISYHFPVLLEWKEHLNPCAYPFKFNQSWLGNEDFIQMIRTEWPLIHSDASLDFMNAFSGKLRLLKEKVKPWIKAESLKLKDKSFMLEEEISSLLLSSHSAILNDEQNHRLISLKADLQKLLDHELYSARLQSRVAWASNGDANTKYFHAMPSARKNHNAI